MSSIQFHIPHSITTEQAQAIANGLTTFLGSTCVSFSPYTDTNGTRFVATDACYISRLRLERMRALLDGVQAMLRSSQDVKY